MNRRALERHLRSHGCFLNYQEGNRQGDLQDTRNSGTSRNVGRPGGSNARRLASRLQIDWFDSVSAPPAGLELPTGLLTRRFVPLIEDTVYFSHIKS